MIDEKTIHSLSSDTKVLLVGGGELGREVVIELQRLGVTTIVIDRYHRSPAMQVADYYEVVDITNQEELESAIFKHQPTIIVPELEGLNIKALFAAEERGIEVVPNAKAVETTMDRRAIRTLVNGDLAIKTSQYGFSKEYDHFVNLCEHIGFPCVVKPTVSSSGKGQSIVKSSLDVKKAWDFAQSNNRTGEPQILIVEEFIDFDYELTLLTVRTKYQQGRIHFCEPIRHTQVNGDYRQSWQPALVGENVLEEAQSIARRVVEALGGFGIFGVELFVKGDEVYFSEVSPRPHDTGLVTLMSQNMSEFELHVRAFLDLPIMEIKQMYGGSASSAILTNSLVDEDQTVEFAINGAMAVPNTKIHLFGKPPSRNRRMGVVLAGGNTTEDAIATVQCVSNSLRLRNPHLQ